VWAVPNGKKATEGRYIPAKKEEWEKQGERLLRVLLDATTMLPIGEDLVSLNP
jgi:4-alpha-glucanotransferase